MTGSYHRDMASGAARAIAYQPRPGRTGLPPVLVKCTDPSCGLRFNTAAKTHTRCPKCGQDFRVHRSPQVRRVSQPQRPALSAVRQAPVPVRQPAAFPISLVPVRQAAAMLPAPVRPLAADLEDDDETYTYDRSGRLVVAEQAPDGTWVPAAIRLPSAAPVRALPPPARQTARPSTWDEAIVFLGLRLRLTTDPDRCHLEGCHRESRHGISECRFLCDHHYQLLARVINGKPA